MTPSAQPTFRHRIGFALSRFWREWQAYWFQQPAGLSAAITRIALSLVHLVEVTPESIGLGRVFTTDWSRFLAAQSPELYYPFGPLALLGSKMPSADLCRGIELVALISTLTSLIGLGSRTSLFVSLIANLILCRVLEGFMPMWSHGENVIFLVHIALLFSRAGGRLSVDALIARWRGRKPRTIDTESLGPILLAQAAAALMFFNSGWWKLYRGGLGGGWMFSDSLRNHLMTRYPQFGEPMPGFVYWVASHPLAYQTMAVCHMIGQLMPIVAMFMVKRPLLRMFFGAFFLLETLGLGWVMSLWNMRWLPLFAVFVDWDWLASRLRRAPAPAPAIEAQSPRFRAAFSVFGIVFLGYYCLVAFNLLPRTARELKTYPFTAFTIYSTVAANPPFDRHLPYYYSGVTFEFESDSLSPQRRAELAQYLRMNYYTYASLDSFADRRAALARVRAVLQEREPNASFRNIRIIDTLFEYPPYPAAPEVKVAVRAFFAMEDAHGKFRAAKGKFLRSRDGGPLAAMDIETEGYENPTVEIFIGRNFGEPPRRQEGAWKQERFYFNLSDPNVAQAIMTVREGDEPADVYRLRGR